MTYLGIDIGTSGVKALLIDREGRALGETHAAAVEPVRPHPGWSEQNPADWWNAVLEAVDRLAAAHPAEMAAVRGIGLSGHMHGAVLLGRNDEVLRPCDPVERRALGRRMRGNGSGAARAARHCRQHRHARLHRAQDRLGAQARAGCLRTDRQGAAAQGLYPADADRRACRGNVRRFRHAVARCGASATGRTRCSG
jgi:sugar (pentulose or hexulose) kinase